MTIPARDAPDLAVDIRAMAAPDLSAVDRIYRLAFGREFNLPDPMLFREGSGVVPGRFAMFPDGCFVACVDGEITGFGMTNRWGSVGFLGPICVHPEAWGRGIARKLIAKCVAQFDLWKCTASGLFTNPSSPRHIRLYQEFGFWPRALTLVMSRKPDRIGKASPAYTTMSRASSPRATIIEAIARTTERTYAGMDLSCEIERMLDAGHGDVFYRSYPDGVDFALCHYGLGSEGGPRMMLVKYAQVAPGVDALRRLAGLVEALLDHAASLELEKIVLGVNSTQHAAYRMLLDFGFRADMHGARMHRPFLDLLDDAETYVLADWR